MVRTIQKDLETKFNQLDKVLLTIKNRKNEQSIIWLHSWQSN